MDDDDGGLGSGVRLIVTAVVSAAVTATLVIGVGQSLFDRSSSASAHAPTLLVQTAR